MWGGVDIGEARIKLSGSPKTQGASSVKSIKERAMLNRAKTSLKEK